MTDYTDPSTVDVDVVMGNITGDYQVRGHLWTDKPSWPNVTVKALTDEIQRLRAGEGTAQPDPSEIGIPDVQEAYRQMAVNAAQWDSTYAEVAAEMARLREENGRLRTALRLSEVALADWERSYPAVASGEGTAPQVPADGAET